MEVAVLWIAKPPHQMDDGKAKGKVEFLTRKYVCYELSGEGIEGLPPVVQPAFGFVTDQRFKTEHLKGDKQQCEIGTGIVGTTLQTLEAQYLRLSEDENGELQGRDGLYSADVDLPPGMSPKPMSCMCIPVIFDRKLIPKPIFETQMDESMRMKDDFFQSESGASDSRMGGMDGGSVAGGMNFFGEVQDPVSQDVATVESELMNVDEDEDEGFGDFFGSVFPKVMTPLTMAT